MDFSDRLCRARKAKNWSQSDLARKSGLTRAAISKWEKGTDGKPSAPALYKCAKCLDLSVEELLTGRKARRAEWRVPDNRKCSIGEKPVWWLAECTKEIKRHKRSLTSKDWDALSKQVRELSRLVDHKPATKSK